jgi:hypothetical protein
MNALDVGDEDARQRLDRLIVDIETRRGIRTSRRG